METDGARSSSSRSGGNRSSAGDPALIVAARAGDSAAFMVLQHRHEQAAFRLATLLAGSGDAAAELVRQAFDQARRTLESGGGPDCAFRLQILRDVRSAAAATGVAPVAAERGSGDDAAADPANHPDADPIVRQSFLSLPERWGSVLWHTDVEHQSDAEVGLLLGMRTATVTTLAARSREGLVRGYLAGQVHQLDDPTCTQVLEQLRRNALSGADTPQDPAVEEHLRGCDGCTTAAQTLSVLTGDLGAVLAVVALAEQGIPYLEAVEAGRAGAGVPLEAGARIPSRTRSMRVVLVAVALLAVTAAVPALRAGAGQDSLAATALDPSVEQVAETAATAGGMAAPGTATATGGSATASTTGPGTTGAQRPSTGRATITTTGVNGLPTRISVSTMTSIGVDGVPTTVAVIPGVSGAPATTVTGSIPTTGRPAGLPDFSTYYPGAPDGSATATTSTGGGWPAAPPNPTAPPVFGASTAPQTTAPAPPATTTPGAIGPGTTGPGATLTATPTTAATSTSTAVVDPPAPPGNPDPTTSSDEPTTDPTTDEPTTDEPTTEPTTDPTDEPTTEPDPEPVVMVQTPPTLVAFLPVLRTAATFFSISNQTGVAIPEQTLTVSVPRGISASSIGVEGSPGDCESTGAGTFSCEIPALSEDDRSRLVTLTLSAADDAESGDIVVSVTGSQQTGRISVLL